MTYVQSAAANLKDAGEVVKRHVWLVVAVFSILMIASALVIDKIPRSYTAGANVLVVNGNSRNDPTLSSPDLPSIATSTVVLERVKQKLALSVPIQEMKHNVSAKSPPYKSSIMRIGYSDESPALAAMIANGVADELTRYYNELSTSRYDANLQALDSELTKQQARLQAIDAHLNAPGSMHSSGADDVGADAGIASLNALETERALASAALQGDIAGAKAASLDSQTGTDMARRDILLADPSYQSILANLAKESANLADVRAQYTPQYPGLAPLAAKVESLKAAAAQEADRALSSPHAFSPSVVAAQTEQRKAEALVEADQAKVAALGDEIDRQKAQLAQPASVEMLRLQRDSALDEYRALSTRRATALADRADALSLGSVVVVDRALASQAQVAIGAHRLLAIFGLLSALIALGSVFLAEQLNPRLRRASQIESLYGMPVVATLGKKR